MPTQTEMDRTTKIERNEKGHWVPGTSGNPKGRKPEREIADVREAAKEWTTEAVATLGRIATDLKAPHAAQVAAATALLDRGWGRPQQRIEAHHRMSLVEMLRVIDQDPAQPKALEQD